MAHQKSRLAALPMLTLALAMGMANSAAAETKADCAAGPAVLSVTASEAEIKCALTTSRQASFSRAITIVADDDADFAPARFAVEFEFGSADLTKESQEFLVTMADVIAGDEALKGSAYFIDGHTDAVGSETANEKLGLDRAQTVANFVLARMDAPLSVKVRSFGETKLLDAEKPKDGVNRRVEITPVAAE